MRISTQQIFSQGVQGMLNQQSKLAFTQLQLATGKRINQPSDDPAGAMRIQELKEGLETARQYLDNSKLLVSRLQLEDSVLQNAVGNLQRFRELVVQGGNDTQDGIGRLAISDELAELLDDMLALANTRDADGEYIFAGTRTGTEPFARVPGGFAYNGNTDQREVQVSASRTIANGDPGSAVFMDIPNGNGVFVTGAGAANAGSGVIVPGTVTDLSAWVPDNYTLTFTSPTTWEVRDSAANLVTAGTYVPGQDIAFNGITVQVTGNPATGDVFSIDASTSQSLFDTYQGFVDLFRTPVVTAADQGRFFSRYNALLSSLDQALDNLTRTEARVGGRANAAEVEQFVQEDLTVYLQTAIAQFEDLDYAEATSRFQLQTIALQAAQQSFARIQNLSLFNYL